MANHKLRIIAGKWRGRNISFAGDQIRPTPDRVRETIFNWLSAYIREVVCLDLYAGSGILGFESLSRGAKRVVAVDKDGKAISSIAANIEALDIDNYHLVQTNVISYLRNPSEAFNLVFIDPPYASDLLQKSCELLVKHDWLADNAMIYFESHNKDIVSLIPQHWQIVKQQRAGNVHYFLASNE